jgi:hypothetical protein
LLSKQAMACSQSWWLARKAGHGLLCNIFVACLSSSPSLGLDEKKEREKYPRYLQKVLPVPAHGCRVRVRVSEIWEKHCGYPDTLGDP